MKLSWRMAGICHTDLIDEAERLETIEQAYLQIRALIQERDEADQQEYRSVMYDKVCGIVYAVEKG